MVRARLSISSSTDDVEVRVNNTAVGSTTYDATGRTRDRTHAIVYDVPLEDGDEITVPGPRASTAQPAQTTWC